MNWVRSLVGSLGTAGKMHNHHFHTNIKRAQHNILKTDKIPLCPPCSLSLFGVLVDSLMLSGHHSRSRGRGDGQRAHKKHDSPLPESHAEFPIIYFQMKHLASPAAADSLILHHHKTPAGLASKTARMKDG